MSFKSKNLEYDDRQPAFLRRMRGEIRGSVDDPDRQINPLARPKGPSRLKNDEDDGPTYVMEDTQDVLSKSEYEALVNGERDETTDDVVSTAKDTAPEDKPAAPKQKVAEVGGLSKKRKAAKIIGDEPEKEDGKTQNGTTSVSKSEDSDKKRAPKKKKAKAIKLSFGDDEAE
jgi:hypothetical protein